MSELDLSKKLDLSKEMVLNIAKSSGIDGQKMQVKLVVDISSSMNGNYASGFVQKVFQRFVPIAMAFDDDQEMEVYPFHDGAMKCEVNCTPRNLSGYVQTEILKRYQFGGTNYAPVINKVMKDFLSDTNNVTIDRKKTGGLFGMFKSEVVSSTAKLPSLVLFMTDGQCFDEAASEAAIREASSHGVHFVFIGLGGARFDFLEKLDKMGGRYLDNATFFKISTTELSNCTDLVLYNKLLVKLPQWLKDAKAKGICK